MGLTSLFILLLLLLMLSAFFAASETALLSVNKYQLRHQARTGYPIAKLLLKMVERPDRLLGVILIGNTAANIVAASIATVICVHLWGEAAVILGTIILTIIVLIFSEVTPKTYAALHPMRISKLVAWPLYIIQIIIYPFVWAATMLANSFLFLFGVKVNKKTLDALTPEELRTIVHESSPKISRHYQDMLLGVLDLTEATVDDIMIPRNEIIGVDLEADWQDILKLLANSPYTRLPVYKGNLEEIRGVLHIREVVYLIAQNRLTLATLNSVLYETYYIPSGTPLNIQLLNFRKIKRRSAIVVDEYGDIQGLVTLEDILEEIVGKFTTNLAEEMSSEIHAQSDGSYIINGTINIRELNRELNWTLPSSHAKTLSGLIIEYLEIIPKTSLCLWLGPYRMEVMKITDNIIKTVRVLPPQN